MEARDEVEATREERRRSADDGVGGEVDCSVLGSVFPVSSALERRRFVDDMSCR